ncbi:hypothetical protein ACLKMH_13825 [Psychromonas sp. KJ10-10]|uniref:hypothetical protein n=1 Tax=Psychromonas sp. KJ10-10 TaxID=3391823 RepID=UPI0039B6CD6B
MPEDVRVATVWKKSGLAEGAGPDYCLHETNDWVVFPYELQGLTLEEIKQHKAFAYPSIDPEQFIES